MANSGELSRAAGNGIQLACVGRFPGMRVLAWDGDILYASRGYELLRCRPATASAQWEAVGYFSAVWWRKITASSKLGFRLMRDGFHALAVLPSGELIAAVPGAIATLRPGEKQFRVTHALQRGTRPLNFVVTPDGLYFASDTPLEQNYIYKLDREGKLGRLAEVNASVLCGCAVGDAVFFTTMIEPSTVNLDRNVALYGSVGGSSWMRMQTWEKDSWSLKFFQYGNAFLPAGNNSTDVLALTTIAVEGHDLEASLWRLE